MKQFVRDATRSGQFDRAVCDFLAPAPHFDDWEHMVLFQHNVETMIWRRHAETAADPVRRAYFRLQADRMFTYEKEVCRRAGSVIAVSAADRDMMRDMFGATRVYETPTGVDCEYFDRRPSPPSADLVFVGSMDWMPNIDGVTWFAKEVLPRIHAQRPETTVAIAGRQPGPTIQALAAGDSRIQVTGTVPDIRPWLWGASLAIVPLRVGGGTRLKIYEAMAAGVPVVSTSIGAEGLDYTHGETAWMADTPESFADGCLTLLRDQAKAHHLAARARDLVATNYSWDRVTADFEALLAAAPACR
jgi:glycosyltransferase involved in cell wall biosynthesis